MSMNNDPPGNMPGNKTHWGLLALATAALIGCGGDVAGSPTEALGEVGAEIVNGTAPASKGALESYGVVSLGGCTGTLLTNRHVLTAHHCTGRWNESKGNWSGTLAAPGTMTITLETSDGNLRATNDSIVEPPGTASTWTLNAGDYSMIVLDKPIAVSGSSDGFYNPIYESADSTLAKKTVRCIGYGMTTEATKTTSSSGFNTLTFADMTIASVGSKTYRRNRQNNVVGGGGDSGSTCFLNGYALGVQSTCGYDTWYDLDNDGKDDGWGERADITGCTSASPDSIRTWAKGIVLADVSVKFDALPAVPAGFVGEASVSASNGETTAADVFNGSTLALAAARSGRVDVQVTAAPPHTMCPHITAESPMSGELTVTGRCLGDGLVSSML